MKMAANAKIRSDILLYGLGWEEVAWRAGIDSLKRDAERKQLWR